jgi:RNA polymerase sigma-70 factor (ECF subfamily)
VASDGRRLLPKPQSRDGRAGLVRRYRDPLIRYFLRRGVQSSSAEDLAQDCFTRIFSLAGQSHIQNEEAYLFRAAASVFADHVHQQVRRQAARHLSIDSVNIEGETAEVVAPDRVLEGKEAISRLEAALKELKPKTREIFLLNRLDGLTYAQIAVRFGLTPSAIEKHMIAALAHLNKRLGDLRR